MRKLALLLGSLVVVASASAKEVVPAPVVVEEAPVQIVEKEVIVYRDKEEGFRPNGNVDLQYRYYGKTEGKEDEHAKGHDIKEWNEKNNASRLQLQGKINMTENQALEYRIREFNDLDKEDYLNAGNDNTQVRLRYFYNHGNLGDSKVNFTSRVHYEDKGGSQNAQYMARFNFTEYMFNNDFVKTTDFTIAPHYKYVWSDDNSSNYDNQLGVDLYSFYELPWGFSTELNIYADQHFYGDKAEIKVKDGDKIGKEDKNFTVSVEAYVYHTLPLYENDKLSVAFNNEGGFDTWDWSREKEFDGERESDDTTYQVYLLSTIVVNYQATPNVTLYAAAGAEYRNWTRVEASSTSNWRWQPTAWAGFKTTF